MNIKNIVKSTITDSIEIGAEYYVIEVAALELADDYVINEAEAERLMVSYGVGNTLDLARHQLSELGLTMSLDNLTPIAIVNAAIIELVQRQLTEYGNNATLWDNDNCLTDYGYVVIMGDLDD